MKALVALAGLTLASFTIPWPSQLYPSGGAYERAAQVHTALVERAYAIGIEPPAAPSRWNTDRANLIAVKHSLSLLLITNQWVHPESDLSVENLMTNRPGYLSGRVALSRAIPGGLPTNWYDVTPWDGLSTATNGWRYVPNIISQMYLTVASGVYAPQVVVRSNSIYEQPVWCTNESAIFWVATSAMEDQWNLLRDARYDWPIVSVTTSIPPGRPVAELNMQSLALLRFDCSEDDPLLVGASSVETEVSYTKVGNVFAASRHATNMIARPAMIAGYQYDTETHVSCGTITGWGQSPTMVALGVEGLEEAIIGDALVLYHPSPITGYDQDPEHLAEFWEACGNQDSVSYRIYSNPRVVVPNGKMILDWRNGSVPFRYP